MNDLPMDEPKWENKDWMKVYGFLTAYKTVLEVQCDSKERDNTFYTRNQINALLEKLENMFKESE